MHEWALAESVLTTALEAAKKEKLHHITEIIIAIGELQQIEQDIFDFALKEIIKEKNGLLHKAKVTIQTEESVLHCNRCGHQWKFREMQKNLNERDAEAIHFVPEVALVHTRCPKCSSPDFTITKGRGVSILSIRGEIENGSTS